MRSSELDRDFIYTFFRQSHKALYKGCPRKSCPVAYWSSRLLDNLSWDTLYWLHQLFGKRAPAVSVLIFETQKPNDNFSLAFSLKILRCTSSWCNHPKFLYVINWSCWLCKKNSYFAISKVWPVSNLKWMGELLVYPSNQF